MPQNAPSPLPAPARLGTAVRLSAFYGVFFAIMGVHMPFWPVWLESRGLSAPEIGFLIAAGVLARVLTAPLVAHFADRHGERRRLMVWLALATVLSFALFYGTYGFWAVLGVTLLFVPFWSGIMPLGENLTLMATQHTGLFYGRIRLWGSIAFIALAALTGRLLVGHPESVIYWLILGLAAALVLACAGLPDIRPAVASRATRFPLRRLLGNRLFVGFLAATALVHGSHAVYYAFATLHWRAAGYADDVIGALWAEGVIAEIVLFAAGAGLMRRVHPLVLVALGGFAAAIRWIALGLSTELPVLITVQALHAFSYGAVHLGAMSFLFRAVPGDRAASAQSLYSSLSFGAGLGIVTLFSGELYAWLGGGAFLPMASIATLGAVLALCLARGWSPPGEERSSPLGHIG